jgi:hypothetical protein
MFYRHKTPMELSARLYNSAATSKSPSAALATAIIFIVDQHVRVQRGKNRARWPRIGIKKPTVDGSRMLNVSGVIEAAKKIK